jgi:hypothetical protein
MRSEQGFLYIRTYQIAHQKRQWGGVYRGPRSSPLTAPARGKATLGPVGGEPPGTIVIAKP